jgi:hypothetical protein
MFGNSFSIGADFYGVLENFDGGNACGKSTNLLDFLPVFDFYKQHF